MTASSRFNNAQVITQNKLRKIHHSNQNLHPFVSLNIAVPLFPYPHAWSGCKYYNFYIKCRARKMHGKDVISASTPVWERLHHNTKHALLTFHILQKAKSCVCVCVSAYTFDMNLLMARVQLGIMRKALCGYSWSCGIGHADMCLRFIHRTAQKSALPVTHTSISRVCD